MNVCKDTVGPGGAIGRAAAIAALSLLASCGSIGVTSMQRDRLDYATAIGDSWKEQALLNIVKLRYFDPPVFLDVSSIISAYTLQGQVDLAGRFFRNSPEDTYRNLGMTGIYADRPTIAFSPLSGEKFVNNLLRPIPPQAIFAMIQAGHQADFILQTAVRAMNDVYNFSGAPARARDADPAFQRVVAAFRRIQQAGALGVRTQKRRDGETTLIFFRDKVEPEIAEDIRELKTALGIRGDAREMALAFGSLQRADNEITLLTRSMMEMMVELTSGIDIPDQHLAEGRARPAPPSARGSGPRSNPQIHIRSASLQPSDAYVAVRYRDHWFWIDDRDLGSKRIFTFLRIFSSIAETGSVPQLPLLTIPVN